jgi:hypothetical protein
LAHPVHVAVVPLLFVCVCVWWQEEEDGPEKQKEALKLADEDDDIDDGSTDSDEDPEETKKRHEQQAKKANSKTLRAARKEYMDRGNFAALRYRITVREKLGSMQKWNHGSNPQYDFGNGFPATDELSTMGSPKVRVRVRSSRPRICACTDVACDGGGDDDMMVVVVVDVCQGFVERKKKKEHMGPENVTSKVQKPFI